MQTFIFDIDGTILQNPDNDSDYTKSVPIGRRIDQVNQLFDEGNTIIYWTARGATSGIDWTDFTKQQLDGFGCKYTEIRMGKPHYDRWIDDKATTALTYFVY